MTFIALWGFTEKWNRFYIRNSNRTKNNSESFHKHKSEAPLNECSCRSDDPSMSRWTAGSLAVKRIQKTSTLEEAEIPLNQKTASWVWYFLDWSVLSESRATGRDCPSIAGDINWMETTFVHKTERSKFPSECGSASDSQVESLNTTMWNRCQRQLNLWHFDIKKPSAEMKRVFAQRKIVSERNSWLCSDLISLNKTSRTFRRGDNHDRLYDERNETQNFQ